MTIWARVKSLMGAGTAREGPNGHLGSLTVRLTINADGSGRAHLTNNGGSDAPTWSPDGARIVFHFRQSGSAAIYSTEAPRAGLVRLTDAPGDRVEPDWRFPPRASPVGKR
jgi:hypothetical protein